MVYFFLVLSFIVLIIAFIFLKFDKKNYLLFSYLILTLIVENGGLFFSIYFKNIENYWIYNIYTYFEYSIHFLILYHLFENLKSKIIAKRLIFLFWIGILIINVFKIENFLKDQIYIYTFATFLFIYLCFKYFVEIFKSDKYYEFDKSLYFWYLLGILLFNIAYLPLMISQKHFFKMEYDLNRFLILFLNILKNGFIIFGIIWSQRK